MSLTVFSKNRISAFLLAGLLLASCRPQPGQPEDPIAQVGPVYLERSELQAMLPSGLSSADSMEVAQKRILSWVSHQVLLQKAMANLNEEAKKDIARQIDQYKESLIIYFYEEQLTKKLLDTVVSNKEIEEYYQANPNQFILKSDIVRVRFVKLPLASRLAPDIEKLLFSDSLGDGELFSLAEFCNKEAVDYFLDGESWVPFADFLTTVPIQAYNRADFLRGNRKFTIESEGFLYYVSVLDFRIKDMVSPLSFERGRIKNIILNVRKKNLLQKIDMDLMEEAKEAGLVKLY